jgi:hypothetical protein
MGLMKCDVAFTVAKTAIKFKTMESMTKKFVILNT